MSWLLIDVGNTRAKAVLCNEQGLGPVSAFPESFQLPSDLQGVLYASVASDERIVELKAQSALSHLPWRQVSSAAHAFGLHNSYAQPTTLGVDRWLAMLGACTIKPLSELLVIDAGTAVTVDHVSATGQHTGGWIVPGLRMQHKAVTQHTAKVFSREFDEAHLAFGQNTDQCLKNGITAALCGLILQACKHKPNAHIFITGGDGEFLLRQLHASEPSISIEHDPWLIFRGMQLFVEN